MAENKDYNFDNFDDTKIYGKHFKEDEPPRAVFSSEFDVDDVSDTEDINISSFSAPQAKTDDYGDDFYSDGSNFENDDVDQTRVFDPADDYEMRSYKEVKSDNKKDKNKNIAIIALTITLAVVIFVFSLIFFILGSDKDKKKETVAPSQTTATVAQTEEQEEEETEYVEPTVQEQTQVQEEIPEPTQAPQPEPEPTQAPQPEPEPTQAPPVEEETVFEEPQTQEQYQEIFE